METKTETKTIDRSVMYIGGKNKDESLKTAKDYQNPILRALQEGHKELTLKAKGRSVNMLFDVVAWAKRTFDENCISKFKNCELLVVSTDFPEKVKKEDPSQTFTRPVTIVEVKIIFE